MLELHSVRSLDEIDCKHCADETHGAEHPDGGIGLYSVLAIQFKRCVSH